MASLGRLDLTIAGIGQSLDVLCLLAFDTRSRRIEGDMAVIYKPLPLCGARLHVKAWESLGNHCYRLCKSWDKFEDVKPARPGPSATLYAEMEI